MAKATRVAAQETTIDRFFEAVRTSNPFLSNRVNEPSEKDVDVSEIHEKESKELFRLAEESLRERTGIGAIVLGGAGVGKSHLLARLWRWSQEKGACYVFLHNVLASPERMSRYFLRYLISVSVSGRESYKETLLYQLLNDSVKQSAILAKLPPRPSGTEVQRAFRHFAESFRVPVDGINGQILEVLFRFFFIVKQQPKIHGPAQQRVNAIVDWLSGDPIDAAIAPKIGLPLESTPKDEEGMIRLVDEQQIKQVVLLLTEMAAVAGKPFIVCVDQVDNLNEPQVRSLTRFLHALIDYAHNLLVVTSGVHETMDHFKEQRVIAEATWDRLGSHVIELRRIAGETARQILIKRLESFHRPFQRISEIRSLIQRHEMFPLPVNEFEQRYGELSNVRPRDVITWAGQHWRKEQSELERIGNEQWLSAWPAGGAIIIEPGKSLEQVIDEAVKAKMREAVAQRREQEGSLPPDADNLATVVHSLLSNCADRNGYSLWSIRRIAGERPSFHLELKTATTRDVKDAITAVCFITTQDGRTSNSALTRLLRVQSRLDRRILVTDEERAPLPMTSKGKEYYEELTQLGSNAFTHIKMDFQQYAELDALHGVIAQARVGDLEVEDPAGDIYTVSESEVVASLHRQDLFCKHPLLGELTGTASIPPANATLPEKDIRETVMGNLSWNISMSTNELTKVFLSQRSELDISFEDAHRQLVKCVQRMAEEKLIHAKEYNGALLLMLT